MKVIATKPGYHGKLREPGDIFDVADGSKASWFEPVEKKAEAKKATNKADADKQDSDTPA